jgi:hypothetical protein
MTSTALDQEALEAAHADTEEALIHDQDMYWHYLTEEPEIDADAEWTLLGYDAEDFLTD